MRRSLDCYQRYVNALVIHPAGSSTFLPKEFNNIPLGEKTGLILQAKTIQIRGNVFAYNSSIVQNNSEYLLFFRYDLLDETSFSGYFSRIGCVELDAEFAQTDKEFATIDIGSSFAEDARVFQTKEASYLVYNDVPGPSTGSRRFMHMAEIDLSTLKVKKIAKFDPGLQFVEKNWVPFEYIDHNGKSNLYFEYSIAPLKLFKVADFKSGSLHHFSPLYHLKSDAWPGIWGSVRGGTPAQKIDDEYLAFFHSSFRDSQGLIWYCMGAYTFEASPPFRMTGISHYPILFEGIYTATPMNLGDPLKRVIFPCGFILEKKEGGDVIHLSCGENDSVTKIITLSKDQLIKSMKRIKLEKIRH